jgi:RNA polymerase sigma-70 factor (ECF subfamily)
MTKDLLMSETELIARARAGDAEAFCALASLYGRRVYALALHYCRDAADAEDLSQEVWLRAFRSLETFRAESSFYTWLRRIAVNLFLNDRRAARTRPTELTRPRYDAREATSAKNEDDSMDEIDVARPFDSESALNDRLLAGRVRDALSELSPRQRVAFLLKHEEGMTYEEIARELGCSAGTIKKSLSRAVAKLRAHLSAGNAKTQGTTNETTNGASNGASNETTMLSSA